MAFTYNLSGTFNIALLDLGTLEISPFTEPATPGDAEPDWSPDGRVIAFISGSRRGNNFEIFTRDINGGEPRLILPTRGDAMNTSPRYSPDGKRIAFATNRDGNFEVYVADADGQNPLNITNHPSNDAAPSWSPDGKQIAFASDRMGTFGIYVMDADGSNVRVIFDAPNEMDFRPSFSPDGKRIVFAHHPLPGSDAVLAIIDAEGGTPRFITQPPAQASHARWLDNQTIIYSGRPSGTGTWQLYTIKADGSGLRQLTFNTSANHRNPAPAPIP